MGKIGDAFVRIGAKLAPFKKAMAFVRDRLRRIGAGFARIAKLAAVAFAVAIPAAMVLGIKAAAEQEDALLAVAAALAKTGDFSKKTLKELESFAAGMQNLTKFGDELILNQIAFGKNLGISTGQLKEAAKASIGLAAIIGRDLKTAFNLVARAAVGDTTMLKRYGITIEETLSPQEKFNAVLLKGAQGFQLAEAAARTTIGRFVQFKNAVGDAFEAIGDLITGARGFAPVLRAMTLRLQAFIIKLEALAGTQAGEKLREDLIETARILTLAAIRISGALAQAIGFIGALVTEGLRAAIDTERKIAGVFGTLAVEAESAFDKIRKLSKQSTKDLELDFLKGISGAAAAVSKTKVKLEVRVVGATEAQQRFQEIVFEAAKKTDDTQAQADKIAKKQRDKMIKALDGIFKQGRKPAFSGV